MAGPRRCPIMGAIAPISLIFWGRVTAGPRRCHIKGAMALIALIFSKYLGWGDGRATPLPYYGCRGSSGSNICQILVVGGGKATPLPYYVCRGSNIPNILV